MKKLIQPTLSSSDTSEHIALPLNTGVDLTDNELDAVVGGDGFDGSRKYSYTNRRFNRINRVNGQLARHDSFSHRHRYVRNY